MLDFQQYQTEFAAHIRDPKTHKKPARVVEARMAVYREAVFNNIAESTSVCFPICQAVMGKRAWDKILREFVANFAAGSPIFREIPQQFLQYLETVKNSPAYFKQLAHYEWAELAVSHLPENSLALSKNTDLLKQKPVLAPHMLLDYDFAVHKISAKYKPKTNTKAYEKTYLLVFRNSVFDINFIELNPITYQLLSAIENNSMTGKQALMRLADELINMDATAILQYGGAILADLADQEAIVGSVKVGRT